MKSDHVITVAKLAELLRFGGWVVKVGMVMQQYTARKTKKKKKHTPKVTAHVMRAWLDDGSLWFNLQVDGVSKTYSYPLEDLTVVRSGHAHSRVYTLCGVVDVVIAGPDGTTRMARRERCLAKFARGKGTKKKTATPRTDGTNRERALRLIA